MFGVPVGLFDGAFGRIKKSILNLDVTVNARDLCDKWARDTHVFCLIYLWSSYWDSENAFQDIHVMDSDANLLKRIDPSRRQSNLLFPGLVEKIRVFLAGEEQRKRAKMS